MAEPENKPEVMIISSSPGRGGAEKSLSPRNLRTDFRQIFIPSEIKIQGVVLADNGTCRLNNVEPEKWLRYVIEHIQDWPANRVRDLFPGKLI